MHESVKAREIEHKIMEKAKLKGIENVKKAVLKAGRASGESPEELIHILKAHMNISDFQIVEEQALVKCCSCGLYLTENQETLLCPECGSIKSEIISGRGFEVLDVS